MFGFLKNIFKQPNIVIGDIWVYKEIANPLAPIRFYRIIDMKTDKNTNWGTAIRIEETVSKEKYDYSKRMFYYYMKPLVPPLE